LVKFCVTSDVGQPHEENSFASSGKEGNNIVSVSVWVMGIAD